MSGYKPRTIRGGGRVRVTPVGRTDRDKQRDGGGIQPLKTSSKISDCSLVDRNFIFRKLVVQVRTDLNRS